MTFHFTPPPRETDTVARDPRWHALRLVQSAREALGLRDRDIAILRGMLSLIDARAWASEGPVMIYASNRVLSERCDGVEERTLRRRLMHLCSMGLIERRLSPNRKRYTVRDAEGAVLISYGFDLSPLRHALPRIEALAEEAARTAQQIRGLRARLRDHLWHIGVTAENAAPEYRRLLRNRVTVAELEAAIAALPQPVASQMESAEDQRSTAKMSDSHSENVRDILSSYKENLKEEPKLSLAEVKAACPAAIEYAPSDIGNWSELFAFSRLMAQALGLNAETTAELWQVLNPTGFALCILGILQASNRIRSPQSYAVRIVMNARQGQVDVLRMFRSLTRPTLGFRPETRRAITVER